MTKQVRYELWEVERNYHDLLAAQTVGPEERACAEIAHYANVYAQDGAVKIKGPFPCK